MMIRASAEGGGGTGAGTASMARGKALVPSPQCRTPSHYRSH